MLKLHSWAMALALATAALPGGAAAAEGNWGAGGDSQIDNVWAFLREVDRTLLMAREGEYGEISEGDQYRVEEAGRTIRSLLSGRSSSANLDSADRSALADAREVIGSVLRTADKEREVCIKVPITGSRIHRPECLTVEEREDRAFYERERRWPPA